MENSLTYSLKILPSICDASACLGVKDAVSAIQDIASEHAYLLGVGGPELLEKSGAYWVTVKTMLRFYRRPAMFEEARLTTWPLRPANVKDDRHYLMERGGERLLDGRTEWAMIDAGTRALRRIDSTCYPHEMACRTDLACDRRWQRVTDDFAPGDAAARFTVQYADIDIARHTNNVMYVRMLLDTFSVEWFEKHFVSFLEIDYREESHEGDQLTVLRRETDGGWRFAIRKPDGGTAVYAWLEAQPI